MRVYSTLSRKTRAVGASTDTVTVIAAVVPSQTASQSPTEPVLRSANDLFGVAVGVGAGRVAALPELAEALRR